MSLHRMTPVARSLAFALTLLCTANLVLAQETTDPEEEELADPNKPKPKEEPPKAPAAENPVEVAGTTPEGPAEEDADLKVEGKNPNFRLYRAGQKMNDLANEIAAKMRHVREWHKERESLHLVMLLDSSTSNARALKEFDQYLGDVFKLGPEGLKISVVSLRSEPAIVRVTTADPKEVRRGVRDLIEETRNSQTRARLKLNPAQRRQIAAWDGLVFVTPDDCVKDWCAGVRFLLKEMHPKHPIDAILYMTLDNPDTENEIEALIQELNSANVVFMAAAPDTMLTTGDPMALGERQKFYEECKKQLGIDYGPNFFFHRRESAVNELVSVDGLDGPVECVGNPTGWGYYGLSRVAYATDGGYYMISDLVRPQCACIFHKPGDRLTGAVRADEVIRPGPLPGFPGKEKHHPSIEAYEFDPTIQDKFMPCLLSRDKVFEIYAKSPYYKYLFSLRNREALDKHIENLLKKAGKKEKKAAKAAGEEVPEDREYNEFALLWKDRYWTWGEHKYWYGAWNVEVWDNQPNAKVKEDLSFDQIVPLRINTGQRSPPSPWNQTAYSGPGASGYSNFYSVEGLQSVAKWLDGAIKGLDEYIQKVRDETPKTEPTVWDHRAIAQIGYFILCLENQRFYLAQYRAFLKDLDKDPHAAPVFLENKSEAEAKKRLDEVREQLKQAKGQRVQGVPVIHVRMDRLLKQRCETFEKVMVERGPIWGGEEGKKDLDRFLAAKRDFQAQVGENTWANFFTRGWQRQYSWVRHDPVHGGGGGGSSPPRIPVPPAYQPPPSPSAPTY